MEAVPRLHMLWFALKASPEGTSFMELKKYIAEYYHEDPECYSKEIYELETLRNKAMHPTKDGCSTLKRYYCQLNFLINRFPQLKDRNVFTFTWKDLYQNHINKVTDIRYELAAVLFNVAASHTQVGASITRGDAEGMKLACTHFQCAAWSFGELRKRYENVNSGNDFMTLELLVFMQQVSFAQAQECILEKSLLDNRKPNIVAKVTAQIVVYYDTALAALLTGGDNGPISQVIDTSVYKLWRKYVQFKISFLSCILYLHQGQHAEEQQKMGERVTLYQVSLEKLEEARKESKGLPDQKEINESLVFTTDIVEAKYKNAKNENEFIYHEIVPELNTIGAVQGANLVNGIAFSTTDPDVAGEDIFAKLIPMKAHEASSLYSEEKAKLLRTLSERVAEKDAELVTFMSSLTSLEHLNVNEEKANKIPQGIVDRCAALNAKKTAITDLISVMAQLADICADVEINLKEINTILSEEEYEENNFEAILGVSRTPPNAHIIELTREFQKYAEAHSRAGESNDTLRKAMELHVNNLKILSRPLNDIQHSAPKLSSELNMSEIFKGLKLILNKVNEMKAQRTQFLADLRIAINDDDITSKVIADGAEDNLQLLFKTELQKHAHLAQLLDQNLLAQKNILQALTESYAKAAPLLKTLADVKYKRENFFSSLAASYDIYEDLLMKSSKGLEFYKKLSGNVQKLLTRLKSAHDVQREERQQRLKSVPPTKTVKNISTANSHSISSNSPKLRDYLKPKTVSDISTADALTSDVIINSGHTPFPKTQFVPSIRPNPLGSENPTQAVCSGTANAIFSTNSFAPPNEPPPPYNKQEPSMLNRISGGYTNPIYQSQQNIAPPAYSMHVPLNYQICNANGHATNISQQNCYSNFSSELQNPVASYSNTPTTYVTPDIHQQLPSTLGSSNLVTNYFQANLRDNSSNCATNMYNTSINSPIHPQLNFSNDAIAKPISTAVLTQDPSALSNRSNDFIMSTPATYPLNTNSGSDLNFQTGIFANASGSEQTPVSSGQYRNQYTYPSFVHSMHNVSITSPANPNLTNLSSSFGFPIVSHVKSTDKCIPTTIPSLQTNTNTAYQISPSAYNINTTYQPVSITTSDSISQTVNTPTMHYNLPENVEESKCLASVQKVKKTPTIDLLTDGDITNVTPVLPSPILQPTVLTTSSKEVDTKDVTGKDGNQNEQTKSSEQENYENLSNVTNPLADLNLTVSTQALLQSDDLKLNNNFTARKEEVNVDMTNSMMQKEKIFQESANNSNIAHTKTLDKSVLHKSDGPFLNESTLKHFHKEVERYEKIIENLNIKTLNGNTYIQAKWKELQEILAKDAEKRTASIAKLFPEKNRSINCIPYDQARVTLEKSTDDYINAALIRNLGPNCPFLIIAQTPQQNTVHDFWSMVWSQKARLLVCLHTPGEMSIDFFWPREAHKEMMFDEFAIKCLEIVKLSHCTEYKLNLLLHGTESCIDLSILQITTWVKSLCTRTCLGVAHNIIQVHEQQCTKFNNKSSPLIVQCLTGSERSPIVAMAICTILGTLSNPPILINVVDCWSRICSHRLNALCDIETLAHSMQLVLDNAHDVLNKHAIVTSYQMKSASEAEPLQEQKSKDPLNELDPLWKLK